MTSIEIPLTWKRPPLQANDRRTWQAQHRARSEAMEQARWAIRAARPPRLAGAVVTLHYRVPDRRRRDSDAAEPTKKVVIDALVLERVLPDDSWIEVPRSSVEIHPPTNDGPALWVELTPPDGEDFQTWRDPADLSAWCDANKHDRCPGADNCACSCHDQDEENGR